MLDCTIHMGYNDAGKFLKFRSLIKKFKKSQIEKRKNLNKPQK